MAALGTDTREFTSTYFALRIGLIAATVIVLSAPISLAVLGEGLPPSISDSWYTDARTVFVMGLAIGGGLLIIVRGDTLTEQTFLNVAGALALVVAAVACWPKDESGEPLKAYDPEVASLNQRALGTLLVLGIGLYVAGWVLPKELTGTGWHAKPMYRRFLQTLGPGVFVLGWIAWLVARPTVIERAHGPSAVAMFALIGLVALLRTTVGVRLLDKLGDRPVDDSISGETRSPGQEGTASYSNRYDAIYTSVAVAMLLVVALAVALMLSHAPPRWVVGVESVLLVLFAIFWITQTREGWLERKRRQT